MVILIGALALLYGSRLYNHAKSTGSSEAVVTIDGEEYGRYSLTEDTDEMILFEDGSYNELIIRDGYARISAAGCPDQICVNHLGIRYAGESIVCLPNKLVVTIEGGEESEIDGSTF